jgi:hypothetical protein
MGTHPLARTNQIGVAESPTRAKPVMGLLARHLQQRSEPAIARLPLAALAALTELMHVASSNVVRHLSRILFLSIRAMPHQSLSGSLSLASP